MKINGFKQFLHEGAKKLSIKDAYAEIGKRNIVIEMNSKNSIGNANRFADVIKTKLVNEGFEISECNVGLGEGVIRAFLIFEEPSCFMRNAETCEKELCPVHNGICCTCEDNIICDGSDELSDLKYAKNICDEDFSDSRYHDSMSNEEYIDYVNGDLDLKDVCSENDDNVMCFCISPNDDCSINDCELDKNIFNSFESGEDLPVEDFLPNDEESYTIEEDEYEIPEDYRFNDFIRANKKKTVMREDISDHYFETSNDVNVDKDEFVRTFDNKIDNWENDNLLNAKEYVINWEYAPLDPSVISFAEFCGIGDGDDRSTFTKEDIDAFAKEAEEAADELFDRWNDLGCIRSEVFEIVESDDIEDDEEIITEDQDLIDASTALDDLFKNREEVPLTEILDTINGGGSGTPKEASDSTEDELDEEVQMESKEIIDSEDEVIEESTEDDNLVDELFKGRKSVSGQEAIDFFTKKGMLESKSKKKKTLKESFDEDDNLVDELFKGRKSVSGQEAIDFFTKKGMLESKKTPVAPGSKREKLRQRIEEYKKGKGQERKSLKESFDEDENLVDELFKGRKSVSGQEAIDFFTKKGMLESSKPTNKKQIASLKDYNDYIKNEQAASKKLTQEQKDNIMRQKLKKRIFENRQRSAKEYLKK